MDLVLNNLQRLICHKTQPTINKYPGCDTKQPDGNALVMELCGMWTTLSLQLLPGLPDIDW